MDLVQKVEDLTSLDEDIHWFCPRAKDDENAIYYDEDFGGLEPDETEEEKALRLDQVKEAVARKEKALLACQIIAFDGDDARPYQEKLQRHLQKQLRRCDICIREFHRSRTWLREQLENDYPPEDVQAFMHKFDSLNTDRIVAGLNNLAETLMDLPPEERNINNAGNEGVYALFEALHCKPFLNSEELLKAVFDKPFRLVQTKKKVTLANVPPGMVTFLFSDNQDRYLWAERNCNKLKRTLLANEFEHSVKPFLQPAAGRVHITQLELDFLPRFWRATRMIVSKLDKSLITNHLRAMDINLYTLSLEHFQLEASHFIDQLNTYKMLLEIAPDDFWDAMGPASPQNVVDTICRAPRFERLLKVPEERQHGPYEYLKQQMAWVNAFTSSIKPANLVQPLRTILDLFLHKYQGEEYPHSTSRVTWEIGLSCLLEAINRVAKVVEGGPVYTHLVEAVAKDHIDVILEELEGIETKTEMQVTPTQMLGLQIVENVLALDVKGLKRDRRVIEKTMDLDHEIGVTSQKVWKTSMQHIKPGYPVLVMSVLSGLTGLVELETIPAKIVKSAPKQAEAWNSALERVHGYITTDLLDRIDSFEPDQLVDLFQEASAVRGVMSLLFNSNDQLHNSALGLLKTLSGEDSRRDSIMHVVQIFFGTALAAVANTLKLVSDAKVFGPCIVLLKLCRDIYSCLCDSQDGILRTKTLSNNADVSALRVFWVRTWGVLETIFEQTETWSSQGYDKTVMQDFCRETMDFADFAFDQYSIIAGTLESNSKQGDLDVGKQLLQQPSSTFRFITKWLRLRDDYLITKAVSLTGKILTRLHAVGIKVSISAAQYVEDIVTSASVRDAKVKTKLTNQHKAELQRALEEHLGGALSSSLESVGAPRKKQSSLQGWATPGESRSGSTTPITTAKPRGVIDLEKWSSAADRKNKAPMQKLPSLATQRAAQKQQDDQKNFLLKRKQALAEQEKQKQAALAKANLGAGSGVAGIGNYGKDHSTAGQTVMVDDADLDSEEGDEDEDLDDDLFGDSKKPKKAQRPQLDVSGTTGLKPEVKKGPTRIQRSARSFKDMRARLAPDLGPLHRVILGWDFFHEGDFPPRSNENDFSAVANSFTNPVTYQETFEPLLLLEAWQGMVKSREENSSKPYEIKVQNRSNVDQFIEISSMISHQDNRDLSLQEGDIILFSKAKKPADQPESPNCLARIYRVKRQKAHLEIVYQLMSSNKLAPQLTMQTIIYGLKVQSITPLEREYGALKGLQYYDLCNQIVRAKPSPRITFSDRQISQLQDVYNLNKAQSEAINAALENEGFSLIQGPPGSGKTKTIVAIVGGLLSQTLGSSTVGATRISMPKANGNTNVLGDAPSKKLLVCAPSNAAVDELVMRLKEGVKTKSGAHHNINVVRIGRSDAIKHEVQDVTIDELVSKKLGNSQMDTKQREKNAEIFKEHEQVSAKLRELYDRRNASDKRENKLEPAQRKDLEDSISAVKRRKAELGTRIDSVKDQERNAGREQELNRKRAQQAVLDEAHVICGTLSGSGHDMFQSLNIEFETVIIDEAAQCVEMSSLIPLKYGCIKCIMVGDPKQLPPTVFSKEAARFQYEQSLFVRMQNNNPDEVHLLDTQYRMHPDISVFPSWTFYDGLLKDGNGMAALRTQPWHDSALLAPYRFYDVRGQHQSAPKGHSLINIPEIDVAMALFDRLRTDYSNYDFTGKIGIITPYKSQLRELKRRFTDKYGSQVEEIIDFNTTDAFQGRESEVIIFSCVRASPAGGIGFLQDIRRMNVGLTRAKSSLWVLGNSDSLVRGRYWKKLVEDAQARDCLTTGEIMSMLKKPSSAFPASNYSSNTRSMLDVNAHVAQMSNEAESRRSSASVAANGSRKPTPTPVVKAEPHIKTEPQVKTEPADPDRMDGVTYKFEDILKAKKAASRESSEKKPSDDVDMEDADGTPNMTADGRAMTPISNTNGPRSASGSRAETPLSATGDEGANGTAPGAATKPRGAVVQQAKPFVPKKRPAAASPFMPKKPRAPPR
ncbi:hypothetical protein M409DRAFT_30009 [Zasmidium cellare ATCC 36951]|uniref:UvrD-like helicase ATP-binding domain-containing protein n=1 Tax=Zasmidium cellare ATCC 36951 TaxID=1080233 RepID=A0A6A6BXH0_ZASCE|nr:uncharacterized protein M409DRAFT_30009 [Zasmidium cellare ATCC 36951]KAF2159534.1 hypothetical protein M409DRAFT_30009 [Zasmidium cellare ATCC 36951]